MLAQSYRQVEWQARRMGEMMDRLDVDKSKLACLDNGLTYVQARTTCLDCDNATQCLKWLDRADAAVARPSFCPNVTLFEACRRG